MAVLSKFFSDRKWWPAFYYKQISLCLNHILYYEASLPNARKRFFWPKLRFGLVERPNAYRILNCEENGDWYSRIFTYFDDRIAELQLPDTFLYYSLGDPDYKATFHIDYNDNSP